MVLLNAQFDKLGEFFQGVNGPVELVIGQLSACNGHVVRVETDAVPLRHKVPSVVCNACVFASKLYGCDCASVHMNVFMT